MEARPSDAPDQTSAKAKDWLTEADRLLPGGLLGRSGLPRDVRFVAAGGEGARIFDTEGYAYVDYLAGAGALILGYGHPEVTAAIRRQAGEGVLFFSTPSVPTLRLAQAIVEAVPSAEKVVLTTTGSEATQYALRFARAFTGRDRILKFEGAYHGNHDAVQMNTARRARSNSAIGESDSLGIAHAVEETVLIAPYNDLEAVERIVREHRRELSAIIVDPVQRGGVFPLPDFLPGLRRIADENGVLLVFDEVIAGFRLAYGGAQEHFGVIPDLASLGKVMGGGLPIGAVAGRAEILSLADTGRSDLADHVLINGTHHGMALAAASGLAALEALRQPGVYDRLNAWSDTLRAEVRGLLERHSVPAVVDGLGSFWHLAFADRPHRNHADSLAADAKRIKAFDTELIRNGVHLFPGGRRLVTTAHGDAEMEDTLRAVDAACRRVGAA